MTRLRFSEALHVVSGYQEPSISFPLCVRRCVLGLHRSRMGPFSLALRHAAVTKRDGWGDTSASGGGMSIDTRRRGRQLDAGHGRRGWATVVHGSLASL